MSIIVYYGFRDYYNFPNRDDDDYNNITEYYDTCNSMLNCFSMMFDVLFKTDGGQTGFYS